jgi:hypothetical protein
MVSTYNSAVAWGLGTCHDTAQASEQMYQHAAALNKMVLVQCCPDFLSLLLADLSHLPFPTCMQAHLITSGWLPSLPQVIATDLVDALVSAARSFPRILSVDSFRPLLAPNPGERPPSGLEMAGLLMGFRPLQKAR